MDSLKTKAKGYVVIDGYCIAQIIALPEKNKFRIYVAWEWKAMADKGVFGFAKSRELYDAVTEHNIMETAKRGWDIGCTGEEKTVFPNLF